MNLKTLLLAGAVFPFALSAPASAAQAEISPNRMILAQAEQPCPEGQECPPVEATDEAQPAEEPAAEAEVDAEAEATAEEPPVEPEAAAPEADVAPVEPADPNAADSQPEVVPEAEAGADADAAVEADGAAEAEAGADVDAGAEAEIVPEADTAPAETETAPAVEPEVAPAPEAEAETETEAVEGAEPQAGQGERRRRAEDRARRRQQDLQQQDPAAEPTQEAAPAEQAPTPADQAEQPANGAEQPADQAEQPVEQQPDASAETEADAAVEADAGAEATDGAEAESTVEQQLEAQGDTEQAAQIRELRQKLRQQRRAAREAAGEDTEQTDEDQEQAGDRERGDRDRDRADRPRDRDRGEVVERRGDRVIINLNGQIFVEPANSFEGDRLLYGARDVEVRELQGGLTRTIVYRENGAQIVTDRDAYGTIIQRVRVRPDGTQVILIDNQLRAGGPVPVILVEEELPPIVSAPPDYYIVDYGQSSPEQLQEVLLAPPVVELERTYTLQEVTRNERVRDAVPRIDLNTITFEFGSATISDEQFETLEDLGVAMEAVLAENPDEVYLIEGHTDAVGSDYDNLILSDERAEAVAVALSQNFDIPPENLVTEGYGEQYLAVETESAEERNRRVTVRRITPLLAEAQ